MGAQESKSSNSKDYIAATYETSTVLVRKGSDYHSLLLILHGHFPAIPTESMIIQTDELDICAGRFIDIPLELWEDVSRDISNIKVISRPVHVLEKKSELPAYVSDRWT